MPAGPGLPRVQLVRGEQLVQAREEARLGVDHRGQVLRRETYALEDRVPVEVLRLARELLEAHGVVHLGEVPDRDLVPVVGGDARLQVHDRASLPCGVVEPGELEHGLDVRHVLLTDLRVLLLAVVLLVRQAQPGLAHEHEVALRVTRVRVQVDVQRCADAAPHGRAEPARESPRGVDRGHGVQVLAQRLGAQRLDPLGVHEGPVQQRDFRLGALLPRRRRLLAVRARARDDLAHRLLGLVPQLDEGTGAGLVVGDLRGAQPRAVDVAEEVVLGADRAVEGVEVEHRSRHGHTLTTSAERLHGWRVESADG